MEAVPKLPMISFELKTSPEKTHFGPKLKQYISEAYREDPESYSNEMHQLEGLRSAAVRPSIDAMGLSGLTRYFCQLRAMQSRFPMGKGQPASCSFAWKDLYANMSCTSSDIRFEMACILYNIGALHTQLGASEPRTSADSLKAVCTYYQNAAWAFQYLREQFPQPPGMDVSTDIMKLLQEICFAQAQECILDKSIQDTRKPSVIGAVATQVVLFHKNSLALLGPSTGTDNIHEIIGTKLYNYWHRHLSFKSFYIGCIVCLYQGMNAEEQQKMGERVAFYQIAVDKLGEARKLAKYIEPVQVTQEALTFTNDVVEGKRKAAKNENEFIYHEEVPDKDMLTDLKPVSLVKPLPINLNDPEISGPDIFSRLVPMGAHEASSMYSEEKAKLLRHVVSQCEAKNTELTEFMSSLQLDQLDALDSDQKVPQEIVDRCAAMNAKSDVIQTLVDSMNSLAEIISDVEHSLAEIKDAIQEETRLEKEYQKVMGARPPSIVQTELSREHHKYAEAHARTSDSNQVLHKAMMLHIANLRLLALPLDQLCERIPTLQNIEGVDRATIADMRRVVGKAREMQQQRDALVQQLRDAVANDDVTAQLLSRSDPPQDIFNQEIQKHTPKVKIIEQNLAAQENIINRLTSLYASYGESRRLVSDVLRKREALINALITSYDTYEELLGKSQKGLEFYKKLSHNVNQLLTRIRSTCQVQQEERMQLLAKQNKPATKASSPAPVNTVPGKTAEIAPPTGSGLKLKDYLPYMKNRGYGRNAPQPQVPVESLPTDSGYYPETIYPTSVRPTPVGSEATDVTQMKMPDGVVMPNPYNRYGSYQNEQDPYVAQSTYAYTSKGYDKPEETAYGYTPYTPAQYSQVSNPQALSNPYYSGAQDTTTAVSDAQAYNQYNPYNEAYAAHVVTSSQNAPIPEAAPMFYPPQNDLSSNFSQMQVTPKPGPTFGDYSQASTYYGVHSQNPPVSTPNQTYSNVPPDSASSYASGYPQANESVANYQIPSVVNTYNDQEPTLSYASTVAFDNISQGYAIYTNAISSAYSSATFTPAPTNQSVDPAALPNLDAYDKPIKSHVTGEALNTFQTYDVNYMPEQTFQTNTNYGAHDQQVNYAHNYQNHPGYTFNGTTGNLDYNYGSQNSYMSSTDQPTNNDKNWSVEGVYTNAGAYGTVQSPSVSQNDQSEQQHNNQIYYNTPYGYQTATTTAQPNEYVQNNQPISSNCSIMNTNQSTYMQSGQAKHTNVTYTNNQVSTSREEMDQNNFNQDPTSYVNQNVQTPTENTSYSKQSTSSTQDNAAYVDQKEPPPETSVQYNVEPVTTTVEPIKTQPPPIVENKKPEPKVEPSAFDLLSDIDFTVVQKPLMPEIKVPQFSEGAIRKPLTPKPEPPSNPAPKEEVIERPPKRDLFSDPLLLNKFTQEVKSLQKLVDSLSNITSSGLTILDTKWKMFQEIQNKENMIRTKTIAMQHSEGNIVTEVVPYDDSRLTLKSDSEAYINASYYKQLAPWCIPLVISSNPREIDYSIFWKAVLENKIACVVCLLSEIEMQGISYWPTAKGQVLDLASVKVTLEEVTCTVHWTERKLIVSSGKVVHAVTHYQINVFPAKVVCTPLVLLSDKILSETYENRLSNELSGAWLQCAAGAGRSAVIALLLMFMGQVRAGQLNLCDTLESGCVNLCKHRSNVLEDTKYIADAYRTALYYVQGVLCSGTTQFSGEAVSVPSGASVLPPITPTPTPAHAPLAAHKTNKFSRESFEEMKQSPGLKSGDMKDPLNFLDPLWTLKKK